MSVQMADNPAPPKGGLGSFLTEKNLTRRFEPRASINKRRQEKDIIENISRRMFPVGVRAPLLTDIPASDNRGDTSFRFDVITQKRIPRPMNDQLSSSFSPRKRTPNNRSQNSSKAPSLMSPRAIKFMLSDGSFKDSKTTDGKSSQPDAWEQWKENIARAKDARDRMYRNTYCLSKDKLRYHVCTLPRITTDRPWTVGEIPLDSSRKNMVLERQVNDVVLSNRMIVPQPERKRVESIQIKGLQKQNTMDSVASENCFEVRRIEASTEFLKENAGQLTTVVRQPSDMGRLYESASTKNRRLERPLKHENLKHRPAQWGTKVPIRLRKHATQGYMDRDYKSVEAYKEYVELMQQRGVEGKSTEHRSVDKDSSLASKYGYENRVLQSVIDVNQPNPGNGADSRKSANHANSIVIEIKPTWDEHESRSSEKQAPSDDGRTCPVNSPLLGTHDEKGELLAEVEHVPE
ncbi:uncharacterized protein LOC110467207 [Mizuhopecten yessoensis]|uniref:Uncharacterized protein n=1 Tax=Mizuhopecten yessoensis TaxID=6573 RepID=A0A210PMD6_MIZYE|nr:uncharacterized protein LOC110467207 [Mizuhopecten yessoensis]XP_021379884.1 uncharacterized protein LOC110467207 [Mizuhopecten yessoensis]XP_021379886.1 uncharacterized protein LOC110467207 [Mizuhopecten yessoensis]XP_021379887.1 uncharacterized protein LOC110467207 [Mizuhopecten yessoensis]XP_021379888.1 uncharacterized protein LOC110467207 [Mizuhopecten yessoensis]XP_021379889.1 uncharacterized protein LOC110467207 [Mizuhopecten yessoensis]XP_021379890.1 uncharacterized protein LOC11046